MVRPAPERLAEVSAFLMSERFTDKRVMLSAAVDQWPDVPLSELLQACNMAGERATGEQRTAAGRRSTGLSFWWTRKKDW
jgi:hypothetical protein